MPQTFYMRYQAAGVHRVFQACVISKGRGREEKGGMCHHKFILILFINTDNVLRGLR